LLLQEVSNFELQVLRNCANTQAETHKRKKKPQAIASRAEKAESYSLRQVRENEFAPQGLF
jgi:hypothetical protein